MNSMTIVTSCSGYGRFLGKWAASLLKLTQRPSHVVIYTHGVSTDRADALSAAQVLRFAGFSVTVAHEKTLLDYGTARNNAVALSSTEWVMHLDADDEIMPHALADAEALSVDADVISFGYRRSGDTFQRPSNETRLYRDADGEDILTHSAPCSGVSPFRRSFWERSPYRIDMVGAWDTAFWIGLARLGARFRATKRPVFWYYHHSDSVFTQRRLNFNWTHARTGAHLNSLRRNDRGVLVIIPRSTDLTPARQEALAFLRARYAALHTDWQVREGTLAESDWCKGAAIAQALEGAVAEVLIIADADCVVDADALRDAVQRVQNGAPWAIPHRDVYRLNAEHTARVLTQPVTDSVVAPTRDQMVRDAYEGYAGGGVFVVRRFLYDAIGGIPTVFQGWGAEDQAIAVLLDGLVGKHVRGDAPLIHLWHEPQETKAMSEIVTRNQRFLRKLRIAARQGREQLWDALKELPGTPKAPASVRQGSAHYMHNTVNRKKRSPEELKQHGVELRHRQSYLVRQKLRKEAAQQQVLPPVTEEEK